MTTEAQNYPKGILAGPACRGRVSGEAGPSTFVENPLQIDLFMQNKPNFRKSQMNVSAFSKIAYENKSNWTLGENKPKQSQFKACPDRREFTLSVIEGNGPILPTPPREPALLAFRLVRRSFSEDGSFSEGGSAAEGVLAMTFLELSCKEYLPGLEKRWHYELIGDKIV